jgi:hypothetical protein
MSSKGLGAEGRAAGAHHRPADRRGNGNASLGRPLRWLARKRVRAPGKVAVSIAGLIEPAFASDRDARLHQAAYDRPQRLRSLPASAGDLLSDNKRADFPGLRICLSRRSRSDLERFHVGRASGSGVMRGRRAVDGDDRFGHVLPFPSGVAEMWHLSS